MRFQHFFLTFALVISISAILGAVGLLSFAQRAQIQSAYTDIAGTYICWKSFVGAIGASCNIQPTLVIHPNGEYEHGEEKGVIAYNPETHTIFFPQSLFGNGIISDKKITFTFSSGAFTQTTIYLHQDAIPLESAPEPTPFGIFSPPML
jgi:hypothetical protein